MANRIGDVVTVRANGTGYGVCFHNDLGGTKEAPAGMYEVRITKAWNDYETGQRYVGTLTRPEDIARMREAGRTAYEPKLRGWNPAQVMFSDEEIVTWWQKEAARETQLSGQTQRIFGEVLRAMQEAEELGGPEGDDYVALMEAIAMEAQRRIANYPGDKGEQIA